MLKKNRHRKTVPWLDSELFQLGNFKLCYLMVKKVNDFSRSPKKDIMLLRLPGGGTIRETMLNRRFPHLAAIRPKQPRTGEDEGFL